MDPPTPTSHLKTLLAGTSLALRRGAFQGHAKAPSGDQETDLHMQRKYFSSMFVFGMDYKYIHGQEDYYMSMDFSMSSIYNAIATSVCVCPTESECDEDEEMETI